MRSWAKPDNHRFVSTQGPRSTDFPFYEEFRRIEEIVLYNNNKYDVIRTLIRRLKISRGRKSKWKSRVYGFKNSLCYEVNRYGAIFLYYLDVIIMMTMDDPADGDYMTSTKTHAGHERQARPKAVGFNEIRQPRVQRLRSRGC